MWKTGYSRWRGPGGPEEKQVTASGSVSELGGYRLIEVLGEGGMARVYRAEKAGPMGFRKPVAIKQILPHVTKEEKLLHALINEARLGGFLHHRNVVEVYEFSQVGDSYFIAMEFVDGWTLDRVLHRCDTHGLLPPRVVLQIAIQLCTGLAYAHSALDADGHALNLVHRDLKPSNIIIARDGVVKIMDFGIARAESNVFRTQTASITKGTPVYMSPEQVMGDPLDRRSDLFSLASVIAEMVNGEVSFQGTQVYQVMQKVAVADVRRPLSKVEERIPGLGAILGKAYEKDPARRYASAVEMGRDLTLLYDRIPGQEQLGPFLEGWIGGEGPVRPSAAGLEVPVNLAAAVSLPQSSPTLSPPPWGDEGAPNPTAVPVSALTRAEVDSVSKQVSASSPLLFPGSSLPGTPPVSTTGSGSASPSPAWGVSPSHPPTLPIASGSPGPSSGSPLPSPAWGPPPGMHPGSPTPGQSPGGYAPHPVPAAAPKKGGGGWLLVLMGGMFFFLIMIAAAVAAWSWWAQRRGSEAGLTVQTDVVPHEAESTPSEPTSPTPKKEVTGKVATSASSPAAVVSPPVKNSTYPSSSGSSRSQESVRVPQEVPSERPPGETADDVANDDEAVEMMGVSIRSGLHSSSVGQRINAVEALEKIPGINATRALRWALRHDRSWKVQYQCMSTAEKRFRRFGDQGEIRLVEGVVREGHYHPEVRTKAIRVLAHNCQGRASSIRAVEAGLTDPNLSAGLRDELGDALRSLSR